MNQFRKSLLLILSISTLMSYGCATERIIVTAAKYEDKQIICMPITPPPTLPISPPVTEATPPATVLPVAVVNTPVTPPVAIAVKDSRFHPLASYYFAFDSSSLDPATLDKLDQFYLLSSKESAAYLIEGYCDERGNDEYNIALGERRASAVRNYLNTRGIDDTRLSVTSYGKEYPADPGHNEEAWQLNRRVEVVKVGSPKPASPKRYGKEKKSRSKL